MTAGPLICPVCAAPLAGTTTALCCPAGHHFDRAREGYVNLLPARGRRAVDRGDTAAMLRARRTFLEAGYYLPLLAALYDDIASLLPPASPLARPMDEGSKAEALPLHPSESMLDAGCGEGWYLASLGARLAAAGRPVQLIGTDISRDAARLTARRYPEILALVADTARRLPLADGAARIVLNVFAPRNPAEFARVLAPGGLLLTVIPAPEHLRELRAVAPLLAIEPDKESELIARLTAAGRLYPAGRTPVAYAMRLPPAAVQALVMMSPAAHHLDDADLQLVAELPAMTITASFVVLRFIRR